LVFIEIPALHATDERNWTMNATMMQRTTTHRPLLIAAAILIALGAGLWFSGNWPSMGAQLIHESVSQPLGAAARADVQIEMGIGHLRIGALDQASNLVAGAIAYSDRNRVVRDFAVHDDTATFMLREQDSQANSLIKHSDDAAVWDLRLNPATPMRLTLVSDVGNSAIDLAQLHVTDLDLKTSVGNITLTAPRQGHVQAQIRGGVGNTTISIPAGVAVRLALSTRLGSIDVPDSYRRAGNSYVSPDFDTAANRVDLTVSSRAGDITIKQISNQEGQTNASIR
jgi:Cell wall-active antibiotics response LiaF, C-terminal